VRPRGLAIGATTILAISILAGALPGQAAADSGGVGPAGPTRTTPGAKAKLVHGRAIPPASAPRRVVRAIAAANRIVKGKPYCYGGGHAQWQSSCYDCSGSISYALGTKGAGLISAPMPSGSFMRWGKGGHGRWITIYANSGHMYAEIAGLRLDTSMTSGDGPGWSGQTFHRPGFAQRHPAGL
jgi:hypothetical protein